MDAFTHSLAAVTVWRARLVPREAGAFAFITLLVAANAPDAEGLVRLAGAAAYIRNYHGAAHSLAGAVALAALVAGAAALGLKRAARPVRFAALFGTALLGAGAHLFLDAFHGYGERLLWPLSEQRYGLSLMAAFDVTNIVVLLLGLGIPLLLNMVNAEIGAPRVDPSRGATFALLAVLAFLPVRFALRERAEAAAASALLEDQESHAVQPSPFLPWRWFLVQDTPIAYLVQEVDAVGQRVLAGMVRFRKPIPNNFLVAARDGEAGRAFLDLAVYPLFTVEEGRRGVLVRIRDLQFFIPGAGGRPYSVEIEVNSQSRVLSERAHF